LEVELNGKKEFGKKRKLLPHEKRGQIQSKGKNQGLSFSQLMKEGCGKEQIELRGEGTHILSSQGGNSKPF